ncbi:MAG TPA: SDR family oxidoreductase [Longimicrobiales bacterium]|nr:SDR family oxidoreductase [Longimicrobiales bacterium]
MIVITGASEGIGFACALAALERTTGRVLITGRSAAKLERARDAVPRPARDRLLTMVSDQASRSDVTVLAARLRGAEPIEGAVLGVGVNPLYADGACRIHRLDAATVEATIATNCTHTLLLTAALLDGFRRRRAGALVLIGSQAAAAGLPGAALYSATKSFLGGLAGCAAHEYAGHGIRVHLVHPGVVRTPRTAAVADAFAARHGVPIAEPADVGDRIIELLLEGDPSEVEVDLC